MGRFSRTTKYFGTYSNSKGVVTNAYVVWNSEKNGYGIYNSTTNRLIIPKVFADFATLVDESNFERSITGASEPVGIEKELAAA